MQYIDGFLHASSLLLNITLPLTAIGQTIDTGRAILKKYYYVQDALSSKFLGREILFRVSYRVFCWGGGGDIEIDKKHTFLGGSGGMSPSPPKMFD